MGIATILASAVGFYRYILPPAFFYSTAINKLRALMLLNGLAAFTGIHLNGAIGFQSLYGAAVNSWHQQHFRGLCYRTTAIIGFLLFIIGT
jgi:hypothetical protein